MGATQHQAVGARSQQWFDMGCDLCGEASIGNVQRLDPCRPSGAGLDDHFSVACVLADQRGQSFSAPLLPSPARRCVSFVSRSPRFDPGSTPTMAGSENARAGRAHCGNGRRVAGNDQHAAALADQVLADRDHAPADEAFRLVAVRHMCRVGDIGQIRPRQRRAMAARTERPPRPESNTPIMDAGSGYRKMRQRSRSTKVPPPSRPPTLRTPSPL